ncbi:MAG: alanine--tRNA ligase [Chloroflexi bacterium]|nr:alanine--tRNA ligase [Chloroflexota bacterium]
MQSSEVRKKFLAFFEARGHTIVPSASLIPAQDPTLLFTNAGMVPFKDLFLGREQRSYKRATSAQRCLRVSGKHNDLEEVGPSPRHHTFFEMLGNFSFGDYFKEETIAYAWEFLTNDMALAPDRLRPTVHPSDDEAAEIWARVKDIPASEVTRDEENFWSMGDTGPCGPNSEIIYDRYRSCRNDGSDCDPTCACGRWLELWSLVFMQFDRAADGAMTPLAKPGVDTGMGFERLTAVLQGVASNYETDLFVPLIDRLRALTGESAEIAPERLASYRAVADHARAITFLIADGLTPANEGRGYVLRRILRRASYQGRLLGLEGPFLSEICRVVIDTMGEPYPELQEAATRTTDLVSDEEERFLNTLEAGLNRLEQAIEEAEQTGAAGAAQTGAGETDAEREPAVLSGEEAFRLYDTFGFPLDLTRKALEARGWSVDEEGFNRALEDQRQRARGAREQQRGEQDALVDATKELAASRFVGYDTLTADGTVLALFTSEGQAASANEGETIDLVLDSTPLYAEAGGQMGDTGRIIGPFGEIEVASVRRIGHGVFIHHGQVTRGWVAERWRMDVEVDEPRRRAIMRNHTATHLLHRALRIVLGAQAKQAGSLVAPDRLRFDFHHNQPLTDDELGEVERIVREQILLNQPVHVNIMSMEQAQILNADSMFDEKYGEEVRVVSVGDDDAFSRELCGGTHCRATGEIGAFFIIDQRSIGAGLRRIEAVTGLGAFEWADARRQVVEELSREYNATLAELPERLRALQERARERPEPASSNLPDPSEVIERAEESNGTLLIVDQVDAADATALREFGDELRGRSSSAAVVLGSILDDKPSIVIMLTDDLVQNGLHAGNLAQRLGEEMGAGGGGRPDVATAGGRDPEQLDAALALAKSLLREQQ